MTVTRAAEPVQGTQVVYLKWPQYLDWLNGKLTTAPDPWGAPVDLGPPWAPGQHMPIIGPTGCAKTTHAVGVLKECRKYVIALDPKGEDETLTASGFIRVKELPQTGISSLTGKDQGAWRRIFKDIEEGRPAKVLVGGGARSTAQDEALRRLIGETISYVRHAGGWCFYVDEFELLSSPRMMGLGSMIERMLITSRRDKSSVVTSFQAPAWVSKHSTRQSMKAVVYPQAKPMVKNIGEEMSWDWRELGAILDELPPFHTATIGRGTQAGPAVITMAPKLPERKPRTEAPRR